jgi:hypothetical protein
MTRICVAAACLLVIACASREVALPRDPAEIAIHRPGVPTVLLGDSDREWLLFELERCSWRSPSSESAPKFSIELRSESDGASFLFVEGARIHTDARSGNAVCQVSENAYFRLSGLGR